MHLIGAHVSIAGGIDLAIDRAAALGCNCAQIFSGSPRVWKRLPLTAIDPEKIYSKQKELSVEPIFTHAIYLANLASDNEVLVRKTIGVLKHDMAFDALVKGSGVIVHLGSHQGRSWEVVREQVAARISEIILESPKQATFLIENSAGQNGKLSSELEEIRWLFDTVKSPQLGWCFDTCHAFSAGYSLGKKAGAEGLKYTHTETAAEAITRLNLWDQLKCIHVNDSRDAFGSGRDRHANLGQGQIPAEDWQYFLHLPQVQSLPLILEVPGFDNKGPDARNVAILKEWLGQN